MFTINIFLFKEIYLLNATTISTISRIKYIAHIRKIGVLREEIKFNSVINSANNFFSLPTSFVLVIFNVKPAKRQIPRN